MSLPEKPFSRKEQYLAKIAGEDTEIPEKPFSREEMYLDAIAQGGGGGGGYVLPIASADTLGGVKVGDNLSIDANGVLSASGGGGSVTGELTSTDYDYPAGSPDGVALWRLPIGMYVALESIKIYLTANKSDTGTGVVLSLIHRNNGTPENPDWFHRNAIFIGDQGFIGLQDTVGDGGDAGQYPFIS